MQRFDVVVVGAGLAGLQCTRLLAGHGLSVLVVDRKQSLEQGVHTTGIFVRRSLEDFSLPPAFLGPPIRHVTLYSPARRQLHLESPHDEFRIGHMGPLYARLLKDCQAAGAEWRGASVYLGSEPAAGGSLVRLNVGGQTDTVFARYLVAADGAASRVARDLGLDVNRRWIVGVEEVFAGAPLSGPPRLHAFLDHRLAPGYIAWVAEDGQAVHVGVGGYAAGFQPAAALHQFRSSLGRLIPLENARLVERRGGRIPVGGILAEHGQRPRSVDWRRRRRRFAANGRRARSLSAAQRIGRQGDLEVSDQRRPGIPGGLRRPALSPPVSRAASTARGLCLGRLQSSSRSRLRRAASTLVQRHRRAGFLWPRIVSRRAGARAFATGGRHEAASSGKSQKPQAVAVN